MEANEMSQANNTDRLSLLLIELHGNYAFPRQLNI